MQRINITTSSEPSYITPPSFYFIHELNEKAWRLRLTNRQEARKLSEEALGLANEENPPYAIGLAESLVTLSFIDFREDNYEAALAKALEAQSILETTHNRNWLSRVYNVLGVTFMHLGDQFTALTHLYKQIELSQSLKDRENEASGYNNLAIANLTIDPKKSLHFYHEALSILRELGQRNSEAITLHNIAECLVNQRQHPEAKPYAQHAYKIATELEMRHIEISSLGLLGDIYASEDKLDNALNCLKSALSKSRNYHKKQESVILLRLGDYYLQQKEPKKAQAYLQEALKISEASAHKMRIFDCHEKLAECYEQQERHKEALKHFKAFHSIKEKVFKEENAQKVRALEVVHQTEVAKRESELQRQKNTELERYVVKLETLNEQVKLLSLKDSLTGAYNRRYLMEHGTKLYSQAKRYDRPFSVCIMDVDHFKSVNDTFGHAVGDVVLKKLVELLKATLRTADVLARYGGEEFVILMPETSEENAKLACERFRKLIEKHPWKTIHPDLSITMSLGLASNNHLSDISSLFELADTKLYEAKHNGRNQVCF